MLNSYYRNNIYGPKCSWVEMVIGRNAEIAWNHCGMSQQIFFLPKADICISPTHSTVVYNLHVHVHADIPNVDTTEWSEDPQLIFVLAITALTRKQEFKNSSLEKVQSKL